MKYWKNIIYLTLLFGFINCQNNSSDSKKFDLETDKKELIQNATQIPYSNFLGNLKLKNLSIQEKKKRFFTFINTDISSYWKGTKWDFNGVTRTPKNGEIACGYFVTNTLSDFGINLKRIWLAQQASSIMIKELCEPNSVKRYSTLSQMKEYLKKQGDKEIFIVGLDFHTGYIIKEGNDSYFLHSNYIDREGVVKENINNSKALKNSNLYMIGSLTQNFNLFKF